jgi:Fur family transcriptional regulator, ferric uptake regulator
MTTMSHQATSHDWAAHATATLAEAGYRRGGARSAIVELLAKQSCARSALEIEDALRTGSRRVGRATVYRVLEELERLELVSRIEVGQQTARYEPLHPDRTRHHDHLVCDGCGDLIPFRDDDLERALQRVSARLPFMVGEHELVLHGHCAGCRP